MTERGDILVIGTMDTKAAELTFVRDRIAAAGETVRIVDVSTSAKGGGADIGASDIAACHPKGADAVFTGERGSAVSAMADALKHWIGTQHVAGAIGLGGSGGTALIAPALRSLPLGVPKLIVSTVAAGNTAPYIDTSDLILAPSVTDIGGLNRVSRPILANAAAAIVGMVRAEPVAAEADRPAIGCTMFGVTTACVTAATEALSDDFDCIVFHATGTGGRSMEDLAVQGRLDGILDLTTTELCDRLAGGIMPAGPDRIDRLASLGLPYVGSVGALDMVNFGAPETVPERYADRTFYHHNPQITLMRTTVDESAALGREIGESLNRFEGPVEFLLPEGGVSALDSAGQPFDDPEAREALFAAIEQTVETTGSRRVRRLPHNINDPAFADAAADALRKMMEEKTT
ncbi:Tm-1-like ATP-binding domain-containing protein [Pelagovum pacificum]|uniref:UPF0261 family protein n=1 Tax=Pelagovum pacificum TaxID=2588711 RepID=A0A5C5GK02_9RHOB|nr:Tm-1-like ATP-binding domain-containing protein [Pelagovum pacificum]QQA42698.1 Tm-1-like ATP-binding domain-containing protein [Pelagovum pacificum]TNY34151.1 UPF0261 family protein [Pelagovum pacificum]